MLAKLQVFGLKLKKFTEDHPIINFWFKFSVIFVLFGLIVWNTIDPDFGWHLQAGIYMWRHGIPSHDIFSYTASSFRWIDHEWLSDVINSVLFNHIGYIGLTIVYTTIWTSALFVTGRRYVVTMILATLALQPYVSVRPMAWTVLGLAALIRISQSQKLRSKLIIIMPLMILLWANLHGGFIMGLAYIGFLLVKERDWLWLKILVLSSLVTFVNPYGPRLYVEIFATLLDGPVHWQIIEWRPLLIFWQSQAYMSLWLAGSFLYTKKKFDDWFTFDKLLFLAGLSSTRHFILFIIAAMPSLEEYAKQTLAALPKKPILPVKIVLAGLIMLVLFDVGYGVAKANVNWIPKSYNLSSNDFSIYNYLDQHPCNGHIFNSYNLGGFMIWRVPNQPVYIDGRMPIWHNEKGEIIFDNYTKIFRDDGFRKSEFTKYDIRCALLQRDKQTDKVINHLKDDGWHQTFITPGEILLEQSK